MSAPSPCYVTQTPQREFAGAKVLLFSDICKKICTFDADLLILWSIADSNRSPRHCQCRALAR